MNPVTQQGLQIRKRHERGYTRLDWLESYHTFSFGDYVDSQYHHFSDLRVINEDIVQPHQGFGTHGHRDMEILTVVLEGTLEHRDSMGNGSQLRSREIQRMSAGTGVLHSEINPSSSAPVHLLQIWIVPQEKGLPPSYEQQSYVLTPGQFTLLAAPPGALGRVSLHQDVELWMLQLNAQQEASYPIPSKRSIWLQVATGNIEIQGQTLEAGDGASFTLAEQTLSITGVAADSKVLLFNLRASA